MWPATTRSSRSSGCANMNEPELLPIPLLRQSERGAFKRCNWAWYQSYVLGYQPIIEKKVLADFGTLFHVALAEYYLPGLKRGPHPAETWDKLAKDMVAQVKVQEHADDDRDELVAKWVDFSRLGHDLAVAYVERYQGDQHWEVLDAERRFAVPIPDVRLPRLKSAKGRRGYAPICILVGTFDLCVRDLNDGLVKMVDHKTMGQIMVHHLTLDEQAGTYIAVATHALREQGLIGPKDVVKGMEYNFIKRAEIDRRPRDEKGMARNKPQKRHFADALIDHLDSDYVESDREKLLKMKLDELAFEAECTHGLTVLGDVSADQSSDNFFRYFVPRTPKERNRQIVRISEEARVMEDVRTGRLPVLKTPTRDCYYCKFFQLCELDESGGDTEYFIQTTMKRVDMYADHREGADNSKKVSDASSTDEGQGSQGTSSVQETGETA